LLSRVPQVRSLRRLRPWSAELSRSFPASPFGLRLAFPAESDRRGGNGLLVLRSIAWKTFQPEAPRGVRRRPCWLLSLVSSFFSWSGEWESRRPAAVAHSNFGPKRASNSRRIYSSNKINISSRPLALAQAFGCFKGSRKAWGVEGVGVFCRIHSFFNVCTECYVILVAHGCKAHTGLPSPLFI
jgi:hypothetical protein